MLIFTCCAFRFVLMYERQIFLSFTLKRHAVGHTWGWWKIMWGNIHCPYLLCSLYIYLILRKVVILIFGIESSDYWIFIWTLPISFIALMQGILEASYRLWPSNIVQQIKRGAWMCIIINRDIACHFPHNFQD